jgi:hypothetical protein
MDVAQAQVQQGGELDRVNIGPKSREMGDEGLPFGLDTARWR